VVIIPEAVYGTHRCKKCQTLDIGTWVQVYTIYMLAFCSYHPESTSEYHLLIVNHSKRFEYVPRRDIFWG